MFFSVFSSTYAAEKISHTECRATAGTASQFWFRDALGHRGWYWAVLLGLILRLGALGVVDYNEPASAHDEPQYNRLAWNLVQHRTLSYDTEAPFSPTVARVPVQPLVMAAMYKLFGHKLLPVRILQILISLATAILLYLIAATCDLGFAWILLWVAMLSPFEIVFAPRLMTEPITEFLLVLAFAIPWFSSRRYVWLTTGITLGLLILTREVYALLVTPVALLLVAPRMKKLFPRHGVSHAAALILGTILVLAPWTYRNYHVTGDLVVLSRGFMWENIWVGTWEDFHNRWGGGPLAAPEPPYRNVAERTAIQGTAAQGVSHADPTFKQFALARLRAEPLRIFLRWLERAPLLWFGTRCPFWFKPSWLARGSIGFLLVKGSLFLANALFVLLGTMGILLCLRQRSSLLWFALPVIYTALVYLPFHDSETRYSQPVFILVMLFALLVVWQIWCKFRPSAGRA